MYGTSPLITPLQVGRLHRMTHLSLSPARKLAAAILRRDETRLHITAVKSRNSTYRLRILIVVSWVGQAGVTPTHPNLLSLSDNVYTGLREDIYPCPTLVLRHCPTQLTTAVPLKLLGLLIQRTKWSDFFNHHGGRNQ